MDCTKTHACAPPHTNFPRESAWAWLEIEKNGKDNSTFQENQNANNKMAYTNSE